MKAEIGKIHGQWYERKAIEMIMAECCPNHILPKYSVLEIVRYLKGKSFFIIFDRYANLIIQIWK